MIKNFKLFEKSSKKLAGFAALNGKQASALAKALEADKDWDAYSADDLVKIESSTGLSAGEFITMKIAIGDDKVAMNAMKSAYAKARGTKTWGEAIRLKESEQFKSDEEIRSEFDNMSVEEFKMPGDFTNKMEGMIAINFPDGDEHVAGGSSTATEYFLFNKDTNEFKLAFENWFPEDVAQQITKLVKQKIEDATGTTVTQIRFGSDWGATNESLNPEALMKEYKENENGNHHSDNVILLAKHFGTEDDLKNAKRIAKQVEKLGHLPQDLRKEQDAIHKKLYPVLVKMNKQNKK